MREDFLKNKYNLHKSPEAKRAAQHKEKRTGEKVPQDPDSLIRNYLDRLRKIIHPPQLQGDNDFDRPKRNLTMLKRVLHDKFVIKYEEIPESYYESIKRHHAEEGRPISEVPEYIRRELSETIASEQRESLDDWIDYLASADAKYPDELKYWAMRSILKMGRYNKENEKFTDRYGGTVSPFPDLNPEALDLVFEAMENKFGNNEYKFGYDISDETKIEFKDALRNENFSKLYALAVSEFNPIAEELLKIVEGKWVKYPIGSDPKPVVESIKRRGTGWCLAGDATAKRYLQGGMGADGNNLEIFYSLDSEGSPTIPRVVIVSDKSGIISEVRGVAEHENLDAYIGEVVEEKLKEFADAPRYEKKSRDMKLLTQIYERNKKGSPLTQEDLVFLYEVDSKIEEFGVARDPRIQEILSSRDVRSDIAFAVGCLPEEVSFTQEEFMQGGKRVHYGDLDFINIVSPDELVLSLPIYIRGNLDLRSLISAKKIVLPKSVGGDLIISSLISAKDVKLPQHVGGSIYLSNLVSPEGLRLPEYVGNYLDLSNLESVEGVKFPEHIGGSISLNKITSAEGLKFQERINGDIVLSRLISAKGITFPKYVGSNFILPNLVSAKGVKFPEHVGKNCSLPSIASEEELNLPEHIGENLYLGLSVDERKKLAERFPNLADKILAK